MSALDVTFDIPSWIAKGIANGTYERVGGVIRKVDTKQVVAWLRELGEMSQGSFTPLGFLPLDPATGILNAILSGVNLGVSVKGFSDVNQKLDDASQRLLDIQKNFNSMHGLLRVASAASILNLGVSVVGFSVIVRQLNDLEQRLKSAQDVLNKVNRKIDLSFYVKFRAALDLAHNAFTMNKSENRRSSALAAIDRFLEIEHLYIDYLDQELEQKSPIVDEYILTLYLAYIAEARCYLELEEFDVVPRRLEEGSSKIRGRLQKYIRLLLTSNPAAYLHPELKGKVDLHRLTRVYQWINSSLDENAVFELLREGLFSIDKEQSLAASYKWVESLPPAIVASSEVKGSIFGNKEEMKQEAMKRLPQVMELMESLIESHHRFEAYQTEVKAIAQLGMSFHEWLQLTPAGPKPDATTLMYLIPNEPLAV